MSPCFLETLKEKQDGKITEAEYVNQILIHCKGIFHEDDLLRDSSKEVRELRDSNLFGYSVRTWAHSIAPVKDTTAFEDVFAAYHTGGEDDIKAKLDLLSGEHVKQIRSSLAVLALQDRRANILKVCLDGGFAYPHYFTNAADEIQDLNDDPETFKVLQESKFREMWPWRTQKGKKTSEAKKEEESGNSGEDEDEDEDEDGDEDGEDTDPAEAFDYGGEYEVEW